MRVPSATYRLQLESGFTLDDAAALIPYLGKLGISDLYLSPVLEAERGSTHGYDVTDPRCVRAEIGGDAGFARLAAAVKEAGMGLLLDIVPNHMAASTRNPWWCDLLEFGGDSPYRTWFDLSWNSLGEPDRLHLPILGDELKQVLAAGELALRLGKGGITFEYFDHALPLTPSSYPHALRLAADATLEDVREPLRRKASAAMAALLDLQPPVTFSETRSAKRRARAIEARDRFLGLCAGHREFYEWIVHRLALTRESDPCTGDSGSIQSLLDLQPYRLRFWQTAVREITYRRFFDITTLAGVRVEEPEVFNATHALFAGWTAAGHVTGLRVDHIDGLYDPRDYLRRLHDAAPVYTVIEKILGPDEDLPSDWKTEGTTGYDFANAINGWFIEPDGWRALTIEYVRVTGETASFEEIAYQKRKLVLDRLFGGEVAALVRELRATMVFDPIDDAMLERLLREVTAAMPVYRTYVTADDVFEPDRVRILAALAGARRRVPEIPTAGFDTLRDVLLLEENGIPAARRDAAVRFVTHWQQFTGPVMAKGMEDTALYNWFPLASANDVGSEPGAPHVTTARLHEFLQARGRRTPAALNATSTHDSKRSEDVRTRINTLAEVPAEWAALLDTWQRVNHSAARLDAMTEVLLLQTLVGTWPLHTEPDETYTERIRGYMLKAAREAKHHTSWREPDSDYEERLAHRVTALIGGDAEAEVRQELAALARKLALPGALASLAQTLLKITAPGVPDFYQGTELWCYSLVDPDNRRPVEFDQRSADLESLQPLLENPTLSEMLDLMEGWRDGRVKMFVTSAALRHRAAHRRLFELGAYLPLETEGPRALNTTAFARALENEWSITAVSRWLAGAVRDGKPPKSDYWAGTSLAIPIDAPSQWRDLLTGEVLETDAVGRLSIEHLFRGLPAALLYSEK